MIINEIHLGLLYHDEVFENYKTGDRLKGYIKKIRKDNKIDLTLSKFGYKSIEPNAKIVLDALSEYDGFLPLHDKSNPNEIYDTLKMSKKAFKKAGGNLYKEKKILILKDKGIKLK
jgi:predicted RNA-binding protein (virulence factor B family)